MNPLLSLQAELERAYAASDSYLAIVRRVHAERGPTHLDSWYQECRSCKNAASGNIEIVHQPDCLWLAADACLRKAE